MSTRSHFPQEVSIPLKRPQIPVTNLQNNDLCAGQLLQMICLLGTFEDFFCKQERLDVANLAEMIKDNNTNKKSESKTAGQDFSQNAKILELSFIKNNCVKINI